MAGALQSRAPGEGHRENIYDPSSVGSRLIEIFKATDKPFIVNIDSGPIYDPLVAMFEDAGIPVFRDCDAAVKFLRRFVGVRIRGR